MCRLSSRRPSRLNVEALESRSLMTGGITFFMGTVTVTGTSAADTATVTHLPNTKSFSDDQIRVRLTHSGHTHEEIYNLTKGSTISSLVPNVTRIIFNGLGGNDTFTNGSSVASLVDGGTGNDTLTGGSGWDTLSGGFGNDLVNGQAGHDSLRGNDGNDTLRGGSGNDLLEGHTGADRLEGQTGNDQLFGHESPDVLFGGDGDDLLRGGTSNDNLNGGAGQDGLFGGSGTDTVTGGTGADRILSWKNASGLFGAYDPDSVPGLTSADARINFENGQDKTVTIEGTETEYEAKAWSHEDIERLDAALAVLQKEAGNTKLLKTSWGFEVTFARYGGTARGYNAGGHITLTDRMFDNGDTYLRGYVLHEVGHNWDNENPHWNTFLTLSGWTQGWWNPNPGLFDQAGDGSDWYHLESADFASGYSKNSPFDDFAEAFAAYFMDQAGWDWYTGGGGAAAIPDKIELIHGWVLSL
jgi:hypothetical protein